MPRTARKNASNAALKLRAELKKQIVEIEKLGGIEQFIIDDHKRTLDGFYDTLANGPITDEKMRQTLTHLGRMADRVVNLWIARDPKLSA